ncbi:MAG: hypothetical protein IPL79_13960 [Myxococcales bacterium]|nr:hypothetical protein [Myxococcales bacterium]
MQQLLFAGKYDEVIAASHRRDSLAPAEAAVVLGAYAFSGRMDEAVALFRLYGRDGDADFSEAARFYLVAGYCHAGDVKRAATLIHRAPNPAWTPTQRFYAAQAHGLVSFFRGRMVRSAKAARLALEAAVASKFIYGQMLAHDLRASALAAMGRLGASQRLWDAARELAGALGLARNAASIGCSQLVVMVTADPHDIELDARLEARLLAGDVSYFAERHGWTTLAMARSLRGETTGAEHAIAKAASISLASNDLRARVRWLVASAYVRRFRGAAPRTCGVAGRGLCAG